MMVKDDAAVQGLLAASSAAIRAAQKRAQTERPRLQSRARREKLQAALRDAQTAAAAAQQLLQGALHVPVKSGMSFQSSSEPILHFSSRTCALVCAGIPSTTGYLGGVATPMFFLLKEMPCDLGHNIMGYKRPTHMLQ